MLALSAIDEGTEVLRSSFWVEPLNDASGRVTYCWKQESWDCNRHGPPTIRWHHVHRLVETPLSPKHEGVRGKSPALHRSFKPLPDENMEFFYDPARSLNQSSSYLSIFEPSSLLPIGSVSPELQRWDGLNEIQYWCDGCQLQQARGLFEGEEIRNIEAEGKGLAKLGARSIAARLVPQVPLPTMGVWNHSDLKSKPPNGPYIATGCRGQWKLAEAVSAQDYNKLLQLLIAGEIRHRHQNEEHQRSLLDPSYPRKLVCRGGQLYGIAYHHPIAGSWIKRAEVTDKGELLELFYDDAPPLSSDFRMTDFSRPLKGWLETAAERQCLRLQS